MGSRKAVLRLLIWGLGFPFVLPGISCEETPTDPTSAFWNWFLKNERDLRNQKALREGMIDQAYEQIRRVDQGLAIEIGGDPKKGPTELIISAQGKKELFSLVDQVIARAPKVEGWLFIALKPAMGFELEYEYDGKKLDPRKLWFQARTPKDAPGMLGLEVFIPGYSEVDKTETVEAVFRILDSAMGERLTAEMIRYVDVSKLPDNPEKEGYIKFVELPDFIKAYKKKHKE